MISNATRRSGCPISFGLDLFGDKWTLLVLRDLLLFGKTRFREFLQSDESIASNILADRLDRLERCGVVDRSRDPDDRRRIVYAVTAAGRDLLPVLIELAYWGAVHDGGTAAPPEFVAAYRRDRSVLIESVRKAGRFTLPAPAARRRKP